LVGESMGLICSRTVNPVPAGTEQPNLLDLMQWTPWCVGPPSTSTTTTPADFEKPVPDTEPVRYADAARGPTMVPGTLTDAAARLQRFKSAMGSTPKCLACEGRHHRQHSAPCKTRQAEWEKSLIETPQQASSSSSWQPMQIPPPLVVPESSVRRRIVGKQEVAEPEGDMEVDYNRKRARDADQEAWFAEEEKSRLLSGANMDKWHRG
jgi:hypothetical protein